MKKTRVLYVASTSNGGSAFSLYHMMQGLDRQRFEPMVAFYAPQDSFIERRLHESGAKVSYLAENNGTDPTLISAPIDPTTQTQDTGRWLASNLGNGASQTYHWLRAHYQYLRQDRPRIRPLVRLIRENDIDLLHFNNNLRSAKTAIRAAQITRIPCVSHVRGFVNLRPYDLRFASSVDLFVYISRAVEQDCHRQGIRTPGIVVHNVVDLSEYPQPCRENGDARAVRDEFGWTPETPVVGVVGRLDWWKGHETFLEAVAAASKQVPNLKALIIGGTVDTPYCRQYHRDLLAQTRDLGIEDKVVFTGFRSDVARLMSALDIVVLSSSTPEPFGRVVIEGMAAGKPVIATAAGGVLDIIRDGIDGRLVPIQDAGAMSQAIVELVLDPDRASTMGQAARRRVEDKFTVPHQVSIVQQVYDTLLDAPSTERARIQWQKILDTPGLSTSRHKSPPAPEHRPRQGRLAGPARSERKP
jgi:glycosyltransferase involved in cell wall biosynthesis